MFFSGLTYIITGDGRAVKKRLSIVTQYRFYIRLQLIKGNINFCMIGLITIGYQFGQWRFVVLAFKGNGKCF